LGAVAAALDPSQGEHDSRQSDTDADHVRPLHVLLAEDGPVNQEVAVGLLELRGHTVEVVDNGKEAVEALERQAFDVVLMDIEMPLMDGLQATSAIRDREERSGDHTPIIAMTAHAVKGFRDRCIEAGMDGYISKPIQPAELFRTLEDLCRNIESKSGV